MVQESLALDFYAGCYATALSAWRLLQGPVLSRDYPKAVRSGTLGSRQQAARQGGEQRAPERLDQRRAACRRSDATSSDRRAPGRVTGQLSYGQLLGAPRRRKRARLGGGAMCDDSLDVEQLSRPVDQDLLGCGVGGLTVGSFD